MSQGWWFPQAISRHAAAHDVQFFWTLAVTLIIFLACHIALILIAWRFRSRSGDLPRIPRPLSGRLELVWTSATALLFLGLLLMGAKTWASVQFTAPPPGAEPIEVLAKQFAWSFRYPGPDGHFGRTDIKLINDATDNPFGIDEKDPFSKDDFTSATLRIPVGRPVKLTLTSRDVIHSLFIRELRLKQDVVPGMQIPLHFEADVVGTYEIPCAELCGLGHYQMRTTVIVMPVAEFVAWKARKTS